MKGQCGEYFTFLLCFSLCDSQARLLQVPDSVPVTIIALRNRDIVSVLLFATLAIYIEGRFTSVCIV